MNKLIITVILSLLLTACFEETESIDPETMADCIEIKNFNERDICKLKMQEKLAEEFKERRLKSLGNGKINTPDW